MSDNKKQFEKIFKKIYSKPIFKGKVDDCYLKWAAHLMFIAGRESSINETLSMLNKQNEGK